MIHLPNHNRVIENVVEEKRGLNRATTPSPFPNLGTWLKGCSRGSLSMRYDGRRPCQTFANYANELPIRLARISTWNAPRIVRISESNQCRRRFVSTAPALTILVQLPGRGSRFGCLDWFGEGGRIPPVLLSHLRRSAALIKAHAAFVNRGMAAATLRIPNCLRHSASRNSAVILSNVELAVIGFGR